jgi:hypothetical protein
MAFCKTEPGITLPEGPNLQSVDLNTYPAISSMAVEPSYSSDDKPALVARHTTEPELRPAAEVFGFLLDKRQSRRSLSMSSGSLLSARQSLPNSNDLRPEGLSALADSPSTVGSILVDPPHTATILNQTRIPVAHGRLCDGSRIGQLTATPVTTRASRIPRGRHSLDMWTSTSEIYSPPTAPTEPIKRGLAPACREDALSSATNAVNRPPVVTPLVSSRQEASFAQAPMRSTHRRSVSYSSSRPPADGDMGFDATRMARVKGLKSGNGNKENILSDVGNTNMRTFIPLFLDVMLSAHKLGRRFFQKSEVPPTNDPFP